MNQMTTALRLEANIPSLRRYAQSLLHNPSDADYLVQDSFLRALKKLSTLREERDLRPWLFTIMRNLFAPRWRRMKHHTGVVIETVEVDRTVAASQELSAEVQDVLRGLASLSEDQRQVILLAAVEGFRYE